MTREEEQALDSAILRDSRDEDDLYPYRPVWDGDQYVFKGNAPMDTHTTSHPVPKAATAGST